MMELLLLGLLPLLAFGLINGDDGGDDDQSTDSQILRDGDGPSVIDGDEGRDLVLGGGGADDLTGDAGSDILVGETGRDTLSGGEGEDVLLGGWGADQMFGGDGDDVMIGGANDDDLSGGAGDDLLTGSSGSDTLDGGADNDVLSGIDFRTEVSAEDLLGADTDDLAAALEDVHGDALTDSDVQRVLAGIVNSNPTDIRPDVLDGGDGADTLLGDNGDTLLGGAGVDDFIAQNQPGDSYVTVLGFEPAVETLVIQVVGSATGTLSLSGSAEGVSVLLDGDFVAFLDRIALADVVPGSITVQLAA